MKMLYLWRPIASHLHPCPRNSLDISYLKLVMVDQTPQYQAPNGAAHRVLSNDPSPSILLVFFYKIRLIRPLICPESLSISLLFLLE